MLHHHRAVLIFGVLVPTSVRISRVGSMQNLVDHVLQPTVGNYFRNSAQEVTVLEFLSARRERQGSLAFKVRVAAKSPRLGLRPQTSGLGRREMVRFRKPEV